MDNRRSDIAMFRYMLIREAVEDGLSKSTRGALIREAASCDHRLADGTYKRVSRATLDRWVRAYRKGGFEALAPKGGSRIPKTPTGLIGKAISLKAEEPQRTAAQIRRIMLEVEQASPSTRTLQRHFAKAGLNRSPGTRQVFGRFEAIAPNDRWTGDGLHGGVIAGANAILFGFLDDHSRLLARYRWMHIAGEGTYAMCRSLRRGLSSRGLPKAIYVDNGSAFSNRQFDRACGVLGIALTHSAPGKPQGRGKIERFFRTVREQFLVEIPYSEIKTIEELNCYFDAWVEGVYHREIHTETGMTPLERFGTGGSPVSPQLLREAFLWSEQRTVTKTATVSLLSNTYEVDPALVGRKVELVFDPFDLEVIDVTYEGRSFGKARTQKIGTHVHPSVKDHVVPDVKSTGIDYLKMLTDRQEDSWKPQGGQNTFSQLTFPDEGGNL